MSTFTIVVMWTLGGFITAAASVAIALAIYAAANRTKALPLAKLLTWKWLAALAVEMAVMAALVIALGYLGAVVWFGWTA